jgi:threonylcarbamoyladenosine tRNA methylthiotransferase MtaB
VIPYARGPITSKKLEDIKNEISNITARGYKEIVLTGIQIASYGKDMNYRHTLLDVLNICEEIPDDFRVRLGSLNLACFTDEFLNALTSLKKLCPHFHISLQSGCDSVLKRMNRHYTTEEFEEKVALLRNSFEHPAITTDIIVGFPGESDEEFEETRKFLEKCDMYECHIFKYSRRRGTAADKMKGQLTDAVKSKRSDILIRESDARKHRFMEYYTGKRVKVLTEDTEMINGRTYTVGFSPEYVKVGIDETDSGKITEILCFERDCDIMRGGAEF